MAYPKVKISDNSGNTAAVDTSGLTNALNVKLTNSDNINIGNVVLQNDGEQDIYAAASASQEAPDLDGRILLGTNSLLNAWKDDATTIGLTAIDGADVDIHALHVAVTDGANIMPTMDDVARAGFVKITDGTQVANITANQEFEVQIGYNGNPCFLGLANSDTSPDLDGVQLLGTHALLSARSAHDTTVGITAVDGTHNALHVAISDGTEVANVNTSNQLEVNPSSGTTIASYPQFDVDTSAFALSSASGINSAVTTAKEIIIQCGFSNTGYIVVGDSAVVAAEGVDSMEGIRLEAGDTLTLAATTAANIYLRGSANDQLVNVMIIS